MYDLLRSAIDVEKLKRGFAGTGEIDAELLTTVEVFSDAKLTNYPSDARFEPLRVM